MKKLTLFKASSKYWGSKSFNVNCGVKRCAAVLGALGMSFAALKKSDNTNRNDSKFEPNSAYLFGKVAGEGEVGKLGFQKICLPFEVADLAVNDEHFFVLDLKGNLFKYNVILQNFEQVTKLQFEKIYLTQSNMLIGVLNSKDVVVKKADSLQWKWLSIGDRSILGNHGEVLEKLSAGSEHLLALTSNNKVYTWGKNDYGQCGTDLSDNWSSEGVLLPTSHPVVDVAAGNSHSLLVLKDGSVLSFGLNKYLQLGHPQSWDNDSNDQNYSKPHLTLIEFFKKNLVEKAFAFGDFSFVCDQEGYYYGFGDGSSGQLANGSVQKINSPSKLRLGLFAPNRHATVNKIICGSEHCLAQTTLNEIFSWGSNSYGQLANWNISKTLKPNTAILDNQNNPPVHLFSCGQNSTAIITHNYASPAKNVSLVS